MSHQRTLERAVAVEGVGLHTGERAVATLKPAPANSGITFQRADLPGKPTIPARPDYVTDTQFATTVARDGASVKTIEHAMSAFAGLGVDNALVELRGPEMPILDGSAAPFVDLIR